RGTGRGAPACGTQRRRDFLSRQDRHRAVLRRMPAAAGSCAGARHHIGQRVGTGALRRAVLTPKSGQPYSRQATLRMTMTTPFTWGPAAAAFALMIFAVAAGADS